MESAILFLLMLYREHSSLNNFAVRDEQASPVPALLCSLFYNILHRLYIAFPQEVPFMKKDPAKQDSPPAAGRASDILPFRRSAILAERFYRMETKFPIR